MRKSTTSAWITVVSALGTPAADSIVVEPICSAANSTAATSTPTGLVWPSSATMIAV